MDASGRGPAPGVQVEVSPAREPVDPLRLGERIFERLARDSDEHLAHERDRDLLRVRIRTAAPIALINMSDLHLGARGTDHRRAREDAEAIAQAEGAFAVFGGDGVDNFVKYASAMINATSTPEEQYAALEYYITLFDGKLLAGVSGNHEQWTKGFAGIDYLQSLFRRAGIFYSPHRVRMEMEVGEVTYRVELRHTFRYKSSINLSNQFNRMWEKSDWEWDIGMLGHTHDGPFVVPLPRHGRERWGVLAGSYKVLDNHGRQWGYPDAVPESPVMIMAPDRYSINGFTSLREGLMYLRAIRAEYARRPRWAAA